MTEEKKERRFTPEEVRIQRQAMARATREIAREMVAQAGVLLSIDPDAVTDQALEDASPYYLQLSAFLSECQTVLEDIRNIVTSR